MKKKMSLAFVMVMALLILTAATALAVGLGWTAVNWKGETVDESGGMGALPTTEPGTPPLPAEWEETQAREARALAILDKAGEDEFIVVEWQDQNGGKAHMMRERTVRLDALDALQSDVLPRPAWIPDGYELIDAGVNYDAAQYALESEDTSDGVTAKRYRMIEPYVSGYAATFGNEKGDRLTCRVHLRENSDQMDFGMEQDDAVERLTVDGMDDALLFDKGDDLRLYMRHALEEDVPRQSVYALFDSEGMTEEDMAGYTEVQVIVTATALSGEELVKIYTGE